jgi:FHA domain-containing protein
VKAGTQTQQSAPAVPLASATPAHPVASIAPIAPTTPLRQIKPIAAQFGPAALGAAPTTTTTTATAAAGPGGAAPLPARASSRLPLASLPAATLAPMAMSSGPAWPPAAPAPAPASEFKGVEQAPVAAPSQVAASNALANLLNGDGVNGNSTAGLNAASGPAYGASGTARADPPDPFANFIGRGAEPSATPFAHLFSAPAAAPQSPPPLAPHPPAPPAAESAALGILEGLIPAAVGLNKRSAAIPATDQSLAGAVASFPGQSDKTPVVDSAFGLPHVAAPPAPPATPAAVPSAPFSGEVGARGDNGAGGVAKIEGDAQALWQAFCQGAGVTLPLPAGEAAERMHTVGQVLRCAVDGTLQLMAARAHTKQEMRATVTQIQARSNNPLKFAPDATNGVEQLVKPATRGFLAGPAAMEDAMNDLVGHSIGTAQGMRAAIEGMLGRFDPAALEQKLARGSVLDSLIPAHRKARLWELYLQHHRSIREEAHEDFHTLFGKAFAAAYEQQVAQLKQGRINSTGGTGGTGAALSRDSPT